MGRSKATRVPYPFELPAEAHQRLHGPQGHASYNGYKPWLRDEFEFRCVYCLTREKWADSGQNQFSIDHVKPKSKFSRLTCAYDNLVYCCQRCNTLKSTNADLPDPCRSGLKKHLRLLRTGRFEGITPQGKRLVEYLRLNAEERVAQRTVSLYLYETQDRHPKEMLQARFGYPADLPNLAKLKPPKGNRRRKGITSSFYARQQRGELPPYQ